MIEIFPIGLVSIVLNIFAKYCSVPVSVCFCCYLRTEVESSSNKHFSDWIKECRFLTYLTTTFLNTLDELLKSTLNCFATHES